MKKWDWNDYDSFMGKTSENKLKRTGTFYHFYLLQHSFDEDKAWGHLPSTYIPDYTRRKLYIIYKWPLQIK